MATQNPFDDLEFGSELSGPEGNPFDNPEFGKEPGFASHAKDLGLSLANGVIAVPEAAVGLADLVTGGKAGKFLENEGGAFGFRPKQAKDVLSEMQSDSFKAKQQEFQSADGIIDKAGVALSNPSLIANTVVESLPAMGAGGVASRGLMALGARGVAGAAGGVGPALPGTLARTVGEKAAPVVAGALGEGIVGAGSAAEQIRQQTDDGELTAQQAGLAGLTGAATAGFGFAGGKLDNKLGIGDVDTMIAQGAASATAQASTKSIPRQVIEGALSEGLLEELPQSVSEQVLQNLATNKPWDDGVDGAIVMGTLAGMGMGGAAAGVSGFAGRGEQQRLAQLEQQRRAEIEQQLQNIPEHQQPAARAQLNAELNAQMQAEARAAGLLDEEQGPPDVPTGNPNDYRATPAWAKPPEDAAPDYASADDEIFQSTGTPQRVDPVREAVRQAADAGGALSAAAGVAMDSGAAPTFMPPEVAEQPQEPQPEPVVLQNRDRTSAASIAQMQEIAANPDYLRVGPSRDMTSGAPVVFGELPPTALLGRPETVVDGHGQRMGTQYAVVDALDLIASNNADGTTVAEYATGAPGKLRAVAGNGRTAGLQAAYQQGTANNYAQELLNDAGALGIDPQAVASIQRPVLVRVMGQSDVTADMGDRTNITSTQKLSPVEQAANDSRRFSVESLSFDEQGNPTAQSIGGFVSSMPVAERGDMLNPDGTPTRQAVDRLMAATFKQAYDSDELVQLHAQATDPDARSVLAAAADASGVMAALRGTGDFDVRGAVTDAVKMAVNAARQGLKLSDVLQNQDLDMSPEAYPVAAYLAQHIRTPKKMAEGLRRWGQLALEQARIADENTHQGSLLGPRPTLSRPEIFARLGSEANPTGQGIAPAAPAPQPAPEQAALVPQAPAQAAPTAAERHPTWRKNAIQAGRVARALGLEPKGKRLAQIVAEVDAVDAQQTGAAQDGADLSSGPIDQEWSAFAPETGTLGIARAQMPQIKAEHRGALVNFLKARGIDSAAGEVPANDLKPTQAEFAPGKVKKAREFQGSERSILVSSDGHVVDGHHQWLAKRAAGEPVKVIRLKAPIRDVLAQVAEFPSTRMAEGAAPANPAQAATENVALDALERKTDEVMANVVAPGSINLTRGQVRALIQEKGVAAADKAIADYQEHIAKQAESIRKYSDRKEAASQSRQAQAATENVAVRSAKDEIPGESSALAAKQRWEQAKADEAQQAERDRMESDKYNAYARKQEFDAERRRLQGDRTIQQASGKPFKTEASAKAKLDEFDLGDTHAIGQIDGGFVLRDKREGRESYTQAQAAVLADMGIGENADGEIDATEPQWAEIERRIAERLGQNPPAKAQQAQAATDSGAFAQGQGAMFSRAGNAGTEAEREFKETERAYGGRAAYDRAKAAGKTRLTYGQWVQVRTPKFKAWFGDWEAVRSQDRLDAMEPIKVRVPEEWRGLSTGELRQRVENSLLQLMESGEPLRHPEVGDVSVVRKGIKKALASSADPVKLRVLGDLRSAFESSFLAGTQPARGEAANVLAYDKLLARLEVGGSEVVAVFTVKRLTDGSQFYNTVTLEDGQNKTPVASPRDTPIAGEHATSANTGVSDFVRRPLARVNTDAVSKVADPDTGEPLVVYHGTRGEFTKFDLERAGSKTDSGGWGRGIYFAADPEYAGAYAGRTEGSNIVPAYIALQNPLVVDARERTAAIRGIGLEVPRGDPTPAWSQQFANAVAQRGYDGVLVTLDGAPVEIVAFHPEQIKSATGNNGNFDPEDPDILNFAANPARRPGSAQDKAVMQALADGKSARDVLRLIANGSKDPFRRQVARLLLKSGITPNVQFGHIGKTKDGTPIYGQYRGKTDTIAIAGSAEYAAERIFMHEAMHAATMRALAKPGLPSLQLRKLMAHVQKQKGAVGFYGMQNVDEFVAEVFTNPDFQNALRGMSAPAGNSLKSAWDGFVRILRGILGLPNDSLNALSQALELGVEAVRQDMVLRKQGAQAGRNANAGRDAIDQTETENFKRWFKDSKVVDADGKPLVVYHGTNADFSKFDVAKSKRAAFGLGFYFTSAPNSASQVATVDSSIVMPVYLSITNPASVLDFYHAMKEVNSDQFSSDRQVDSGAEITKNLISKGFDGVIIGDDFVVFRPEQIKSATGNNGNFDPEDPDIRNFGMDDIRNAINERKTVIAGQTSRAYTPEQQAAMRNVGLMVEQPSLKERAQALWQDAGKKLAQGIVDQFAPVKEISKDAYALLRLSKGASGAFETLLKGGKLKLSGGVYDFDEANKGGVVDALLTPLNGEHHDFLRWVAANRAERLMGEDRERLFTPDDIAALKTLADGQLSSDFTLKNGPRKGQITRSRAEAYKDSLTTFNAFNKNVLDMAEQSGLIDPDSRATWESEFYVPFYRVADEESGGVRGMNIKGSVVRQQAFKHLKGGKQALNNDLLDNTLMNWAHLLDASAKNRAAKATLEAAQQVGVAIEAPKGTLDNIASAIGKKNGIVWFMDEGQKRHFMVDDPYIMTAISSLEYAGMNSPIMNAMSAFKHALTIGVTASPFFKIRNLIRDSVQVVGTSSIGVNPLKNVAEGWKLTDPKNDAYFRLLAGGGTIHFGTMLEGSEAKRVQALVESGVQDSTILSTDHKVKQFYRKYIEPGITAYNELGNRGEAVNRAALYDQLRKQGMGHAEASLQARDLMDFSMQGSFTSIRFLSQVVPFLNARLQGMYKLGRAANENPKRMAYVTGAVAMASLALLAAYGDDDDWKRREDWDRNNFWWFKVGGVAFRIPKPFELGAIGTLAERSAEYLMDDEMTGKRFRGQVLKLLGDNLSMNPIPQAVKPLLDVYANKDSFRNAPIESMGMERMKSEYRFNDRTSMVARGMSTAANSVTGLVGAEALSPVQIDHLLRGYFGWLGTFAVGTADMIARPVTNQPTQATQDIWKKVTGGIVSELQDAPSRYVSSVYDQAKELEQAFGTWRALQKSGKPEEAAAFFADNREEIARYRSVTQVKSAESKLNERIRQIERNEAMDGDQKREEIRRIRAMKEALAKSLAPA